MNPTSSRPRLIVFDWDGTLVDTTAAISGSMQRAAADLALAVPDDRLAAHVIGLGLDDALRLAVPDLQPEQRPQFFERYRQHYFARASELVPFGGAAELLAELRQAGVMLAVATGKSRVGLERALDELGWRPLFDSTRCADEGEPKPHPWMLHDLFDELSVEPQDVMMVGDTSHDLQMARAAGCPAIAVSYGAHPRDHLLAHRPVALVDEVSELRAALLRLLQCDPGMPTGQGGGRDG